MTQENKEDPQPTKMILFNIFQIFRINKINFQQYLILHNHPDTFIHKCDATTQTDYTTIRPKASSKNSPIEPVPHWKKKNSYLTGHRMTMILPMTNFKKIPMKRH